MRLPRCACAIVSCITHSNAACRDGRPLTLRAALRIVPLVRVGHRLPASDLFERAKTSFAIAGLRIQAAYVYAGRAERLLHFGVRNGGSEEGFHLIGRESLFKWLQRTSDYRF